MVLSAISSPAHAQDSSRILRSFPLDSLMLERTACGRGCPGYRVMVGGTGSVRFWAAGAVGAPTVTDSIPQHSFVGLRIQGFIDGLYLLPDDIEHSPMCGHSWTGGEHVTVTFYLGQRVKRVVDYSGCTWSPIGLRRYQDMIDSVVGVHRWDRRP